MGNSVYRVMDYLFKNFVRGSKRFPTKEEQLEIKEFANEAVLRASSKVDNIDNISPDDIIRVMDEEVLQEMPKPMAEIKALPLKDPKLREEALRKKLEGQQQQAKEGIMSLKNRTDKAAGGLADLLGVE